MNTAADAILDMYAIKKASVPTMTLLTSLLYTLNANGILNEAISDINHLTNLDMQSDLSSKIRTLVQIPEMVGLYENPKALRLAIELYPYIRNTDDYVEVTLDPQITSEIFNLETKRHNYTQLKKALLLINKLDLGYKVIQKHRDNPFNMFYIVLYTSKDELLARLKEHKLLSPSILDKVL